MNSLSQFFALLAALLHLVIFALESLWFMRPAVHARFGARTAVDAEASRLFAFNQGFYNLFLAIGVLIGLGLLRAGGNVTVASTLVLFGCACMVGASIVLAASAGRRMWRAAAIQGIAPLVAWLGWLALGAG